LGQLLHAILSLGKSVEETPVFPVHSLLCKDTIISPSESKKGRRKEKWE